MEVCNLTDFFGTLDWQTIATLGSIAMSLPEALRALPPDEKLALVTELWNDLAAAAPLILPSEEIAEMQRRRDELLANPNMAIDRDELWRRVNGG